MTWSLYFSDLVPRPRHGILKQSCLNQFGLFNEFSDAKKETISHTKKRPGHLKRMTKSLKKSDPGVKFSDRSLINYQVAKLSERQR